VNVERPNELVAKRIVEREMKVDLEHHDTNGGVDYLSLDGVVSLEVTAVTDGEKDGAWKALKRSKAKGASAAVLQGCWIVVVPDDQAEMRTFVQRVQPAIVELELAGQAHFDRQRAAIHVMNRGALARVYQPLLDAGVERAVHAPHRESPDHDHRLIISAGSGGTASGSDAAVGLLLDALVDKPDNSRKLRDTGASQRHLFVWVNDNTAYGIARPLARENPPWGGDEWGLPSKAPTLDPAITHLWIMHEGSGMGWLWDGDEWKEVLR
jgi:hypothetical protein